MKNILMAIFTVISINSFGQNWIDYHADSTLTLKLPDNYTVVDTMGQRVITARIDNGFILISMLPNSGDIAMNVQSANDLLKTYKGFKDGYIKSQHGQLIKEEFIEKSGLKLLRFSFSVAMQGEKEIRHCVAAFVKEKMYCINFWEVESMSNEMSAPREMLFSSLKFSPKLGLTDQMSTRATDEKEYNQGYLFGKITFYALLIAGIVFVIVKRGKKKRAKV